MNRSGSFCLLIIFVLLWGCSSDDPDSLDQDAYEKAVSDFYVSLAASQTEEARFAFNKMNDVANAFPNEPAAWANLGVLAMRQGNFDLADDRLERARSLAELDSNILYLSGIFESRRGRVDEAIDFYRLALDQDPENARLRYSLIGELERQDDLANSEEVRSHIMQLRELLPNNRVLYFEQARIATRAQDSTLLDGALEGLQAFTGQWDEEALDQYEYVQELAGEREFSELNLELTFLRNIVESGAAFQQDLRQIQSDPNEIGFLITQFIYLPQPQFRAADPDLDISFERILPEDQPGFADFVTSATLLEDLPPIPVSILDGALQIDSDTRLDFPGTPVSARRPAVWHSLISTTISKPISPLPETAVSGSTSSWKISRLKIYPDR